MAPGQSRRYRHILIGRRSVASGLRLLPVWLTNAHAVYASTRSPMPIRLLKRSTIMSRPFI